VYGIVAVLVLLVAIGMQNVLTTNIIHLNDLNVQGMHSDLSYQGKSL